MKTTFRGWTPSILVGTTASGTGITSACAVADRAIATKIHLPIRQYLLVSHSGLSFFLSAHQPCPTAFLVIFLLIESHITVPLRGLHRQKSLSYRKLSRTLTNKSHDDFLLAVTHCWLSGIGQLVSTPKKATANEGEIFIITNRFIIMTE